MRMPFLIACTFALQGCGANFHSIYRKDEIAGVSVRAVDAQQRLIFTKTDSKGNVIVCPEPSPDALSANAFAAQLSAEQIKAISGLTAGIASSESVGSLGLRTQTISLLRDQTTQACLSRMSGDLDPEAYRDALRRLQISALGMLAIEQMTGAVKAAPVVVSAGAQVAGGANPAMAGTAPKKDGDSASGAGEKVDGKSPLVVLTASGNHDGDTEGRPHLEQADNIYQAVLNVLSIVLEKGFDFSDCLAAARALPNGVADPAAVTLLQEQCKSAIKENGGSGPVIRKIIAQLDNDAEDGPPTQAKAQVVAKALAAVDSKPVKLSAITDAISSLPSSGKAYEGYDIAVFLCDRANTSYAQTLQTYVDRNVKPLTSGRVRFLSVSASDFRRRSGGLDTNVLPISTVFYDSGDGAQEQQIATRLKAQLTGESSLKLSSMDVVTNRMPKRTPYYISAWICPK